MGFLDGLTRLWRPAPLKAAAEVVDVRAIATTETGISGTPNYGGRLQVEPNAHLRDTSGYGQAGGYEWGEWEEARRANAFVAMALDFVCGPIRDARVDFEEVQDDSVPEDVAKAQVDFLRWNFTDGLESPLPSILAQAAGGMLASGFSILEPVAAPCARLELPGGKGLALKRLAERLPNSLTYNPWQTSPDGTELLAIRQQGVRGPSGQWVTVDLPREDVLLFTWQKSGANWAGFSAFRPVWYIANRIMPMLLKLLGVTLQREGAGVPVAESIDLNAELTAGQRDELRSVFAGLTFHEAAGVIMPGGWKLNWVFSPGANKGHVLQAWRDLGLVILQQVGAQQLALGTGETGSRSVGEVHDARAQAYVRGAVSVLEAEFQRLVRKLVDVNWGPQPAYPKLKLTLKRPELGVKERIEAMGLAKGAGLLTVLPRDENLVREALGMSPIDDDEREEPSAETELPEGADVGTEDDEAETPSAELEVPEGEMQDGPAAGAREEDAPPEGSTSASNRRHSHRHHANAQRGGWVPWRPLRASEEKMELASIDEYLTKARDEYERQARPQVLAMLAMSAPAIQSAMADGNVTPEEVAAVPLDEKRLLELNRAYLATVRQRGYDFAAKELASKTMRAAAGDEGADERDDKGQTAQEIEDDADEVMEAQAKALTRRQLNRVRSELEREAIDVVRTGGKASEVIDRMVLRQVETGAFKADAGTVTAKVLNVGRDEAARIIGGVKEVEYSAILDTRTCDACRADDGKTAPFNSPEHDRLLPPNRDCEGGDNCRCLLSFIPGTPDDGGEE